MKNFQGRPVKVTSLPCSTSIILQNLCEMFIFIYNIKLYFCVPVGEDES